MDINKDIIKGCVVLILKKISSDLAVSMCKNYLKKLRKVGLKWCQTSILYKSSFLF